LDEAHYIKVRSALQSKAVFELKAERRWCLTGTPMQNTLDDLFSLVHFLKIEPFNDFNWWTSIIKRPLKNGPDGFTRLQNLMKAICMRRTKDQKIDGVSICDLPPKIEVIEKIKMTIEEKLFYDQLFTKGRSLVKNTHTTRFCDDKLCTCSRSFTSIKTGL